jgi:hypothetical protein
MKANGLMIRGKEKDMNDMRMEILMKETFQKERPLEKVFIIGQMERSMMGNG